MNNQTRKSCRIARHADYQGARIGVISQAPILEKKATDSLIRLKPKFLKRSSKICISTFNIRTIKGEYQSSELVASAIEHNIDIICIQEHRLYYTDFYIKYHTLNIGWSLVTSSSWKNNSNSSTGGVGLLLSQRATASLISVEKISDRILIENFNGNPTTTVTFCYSPTNVSEESDVENFYHDLYAFTRSVPKHNVLIIAGDFNAHLGTDHNNKFSFHTEANRNGILMEQFLIENSLHCLNTNFQKKNGKLWTHTHPNGFKAQLDFIIVNKKWINSARNCEAYNTFEGVFYDHRIVSAILILSLRADKKATVNKKRYNWCILTTDKTIR